MVKWLRVLRDIETYPNFFCDTVQCFDTGEKLYFEISDRVNDLDKIYKFYRVLEKNRARVISFNGVHFDSPVTNYLILNYSRLRTCTPLEISQELCDFAQYIIRTDFWWKETENKKYKYNQSWIDVDVFLFWSKMLRQSKRISLKSLGIQLGYHTVQELPYPPGTWLTHTQMDEVAHYNYVHDIDILKLIVTSSIRWQGKPSSVESEIKLRWNIWKNYGLNAMSWDAPKIASELLLKFYCDKTDQITWDIKKERYAGGRSLPLHNPDFKLDVFKNLYSEFQKADRDYHKDVVFIHKNTRIKLTYGIGGIHSVNDNEIYKSSDNELVVTSDVASLYPNLIINYGLIRQKEVLQQYSTLKIERMIAKRKGNKPKDATYKLILNSTSGLLDNKHSWLYYPEGAMKMRLMGQLVMTKTIEDVSEAGFQVVSANTK